MNEIRTYFGNTIKRIIELKNGNFNPADRILFVVRDIQKNPVWWAVLPIIEEQGKYTVTIEIPHTEAIQCFKRDRSYRWGMTWYRNAVLDDTGFPIDGLVRVLVDSAAWIVCDAEARKDGINNG